MEMKGQDTLKKRAKRLAMAEWVSAVNDDGRFGRWAFACSFQPGQVIDIPRKHSGVGAPATTLAAT